MSRSSSGIQYITTTAKQTQQEEKKEPLLMPEEDKKLLKELYLRRSYSGNEEAIRTGITYFLDKLKIPYVNYNGNILGFNHPGKPLFSAHLDMINTDSWKLKPGEASVENGVFTLDSKTNIRLYRDKEKKVQTSLGADDKNGIWVILTLLKNGHEINFALCHSEETGGEGSKQVVSDKELAEFIEECQFGIIIDRRNKGDIIGYENNYCMGLDDQLETFSTKYDYGFKCARGSISDADRFSQLIECVNLSCGYYEPHTSREYTNLNELWNTYLFCERILEDFDYKSVSPKRMREFKKCSKPYSTYTKSETTTTYSANNYSGGYCNGYYGSYWRDEDDNDVKTVTVVKGQDEKKNPEKTEKVTAESVISEDVFNRIARIGVCRDWYIHNRLYIPLHTVSTLPPDATGDDDVVYWDSCDVCAEELFVLQKDLDELEHMNYNMDKDVVYGVCLSCGRGFNMTELIPEVLLAEAD